MGGLGPRRRARGAGADCRYAILGGGCAGLSLALELAERGLATGGLVVIEPRRAFPRDRTWCHRNLVPHRFEDLTANRWSRWKLRHGGREWLHTSHRYAYCELPSDRFHARALERLATHPDVELHLGTSARSLIDEGDVVRIGTSRGELRARHAFDARPGLPGGRPPELLQHFLGLRVRTPRPVFDPETVTLMDFDVPQAQGIQFLYVLPSDAQTALVESTFLSPRPLAEDHYRAQIDRYLAARHGAPDYEILDQERGVIPMSTARPVPRPSARVMRLGTGGGLVRPSTGYAFLAIQRFTRALADGLARGAFQAPPTRDRTLRTMDAIFLQHVRKHSDEAPALFERLFAGVGPDALVRFLGDAPSLRDRLRVIAALPKRPFLGTAWRARAAWSAA